LLKHKEEERRRGRQWFVVRHENAKMIRYYFEKPINSLI
jgi:hypothetical protein